MHLIQKSLSGKVIENKHGRFIYSDNYDENSRPRKRGILDTPLRDLLNLGTLGATIYSDGIDKAIDGRQAHVYEIGNCKPVVLTWTFASLPAVNNVGDIHICGKIFKNDMCLGGYQAHEALSTAGGNATGAYGTYAVSSDGMSAGAVATVDKFLAADTGFDGIGSGYIGDTVALGYTYVPTTDVFLALTNTTEAFATAKIIAGHFFLLRG